MEIVQIVLDADLLRAVDRAAKPGKMNRSALIREALKEHLKKLHYQELERRDREGYESHADTGELAIWKGVATWPVE
jgi:metal-responsive CopG/Arc/MetJ family transcriptional regulator